MPRKSEVLEPLTVLQQQAATLLADGASDERVAAELAVPLAWVQGLETCLPVAAAITSTQWKRYQGTRHRVRSLLEKALDVVDQELERNPSPELAVALLRVLKLEAPETPHKTPQQLLLAECSQRVEEELRDEAVTTGAFSFIGPAEIAKAAGDLFETEMHRLNAPADPVFS